METNVYIIRLVCFHNQGPELHPADITAALKKSGSSQTAVARDLSVSQAAVWAVIAGRKKSLRIARRIARQTGLAIELLWPGKYMGRWGGK